MHLFGVRGGWGRRGVRRPLDGRRRGRPPRRRRRRFGKVEPGRAGGNARRGLLLRLVERFSLLASRSLLDGRVEALHLLAQRRLLPRELTKREALQPAFLDHRFELRHAIAVRLQARVHVPALGFLRHRRRLLLRGAEIEIRHDAAVRSAFRRLELPQSALHLRDPAPLRVELNSPQLALRVAEPPLHFVVLGVHLALGVRLVVRKQAALFGDERFAQTRRVRDDAADLVDDFFRLGGFRLGVHTAIHTASRCFVWKRR